ncbi:MAG: thioether cross-link-forming SCIFF peptide maturase [Clostridiales Family XIII bacterium]|jgi:uncharacterized protein|nr:thioether cross-link-forming SCIFF peptide maturase [Clostridiales Family XIII bacterium]
MIHLFRFQDLNILLDVNSGSVHEVSDVVFDILSYFEFEPAADRETWEREKTACIAGAAGKYPPDEIYEAMDEIEELIEEEILFSGGLSDAETNPEKRGSVIKALCLHAAHDCNMRCAYCFAGTGEYSGPRSLLSLETGKKAIDFLIEQSGNRRNLEVDFFGGEPLLNWQVIQDVVAYGRKREQETGKQFRFTLTTNGLLLDEEKTAFLNEEMDNIILSIDGRPEINDKMRKTPTGQGTYDRILQNMLRFAEARKETGKLFFVRGTYTKCNKDFSEDVLHLVKIGFHHVSVEPVVGDVEAPYSLTEEDLPELFEEYDRLSEQFLSYQQQGKPFSFFHFNLDLKQGPCLYKRAVGCGAGTEYVAVSATGDIFPCHQFVGEPDFLLGNVSDAKFENRLYDKFNRAHIYNKKACKTCWAKYYCSGGCHANALHMSGDIANPYSLGCKLEKKRLECAIGIYAKSFSEQSWLP